jgi:hypothetical protein
MKKNDKKLFEDRFNIFWQRLNKKNEDKREYYHRIMFEHFSLLMISSGVHRSLFYVFNIPFAVINSYKQTRKKSNSIQYFLKVIEYFLKNKRDYDKAIFTKDAFVNMDKIELKLYRDKLKLTEASACRDVFYRYKSEIGYKDDESFQNAFREWCRNISNRDAFPQIDDYLIELKPYQRKSSNS